MSYNLTNAAQGGNGCYVTAGLTGLSGAASTYSTSATTLQFSVNGKMFTKAQVSGGASPTTDANTAAAMTLVANQAAVFVWGLNAAGTVIVAKGPTVAWTDTTAGSTVLPFPPLPDTFTPIAYHNVQAGAATVGTWTFGSSNWNATGITLPVVVNVCDLPPSPATTT